MTPREDAAEVAEQPDDGLEHPDEVAADDGLEHADELAAEDELEDDDEPEAEADVAEKVTGKSIEKQAREFGRLVDGFEAGLAEVLGVELPLVPVGMDGAVGFWMPGAIELKTNEKFRRCSVCNGHGQVLTGSIADGKQSADCPRCAGRGYLERLDEQQQQPDGATNGAGQADADAGFGVPLWMGDPTIGRPPA